MTLITFMKWRSLPSWSDALRDEDGVARSWDWYSDFIMWQYMCSTQTWRIEDWTELWLCDTADSIYTQLTVNNDTAQAAATSNHKWGATMQYRRCTPKPWQFISRNPFSVVSLHLCYCAMLPNAEYCWLILLAAYFGTASVILTSILLYIFT